MAKHEEKHEGKKMEKAHHKMGKEKSMGKKEMGFSAKLGHEKKGKSGLEGPHK